MNQLSILRNKANSFSTEQRQEYVNFICGFLGLKQIDQSLVPQVVLVNIYCLMSMQITCDYITSKKASAAMNWLKIKAAK
jgi:hypothetical protein